MSVEAARVNRGWLAIFVESCVDRDGAHSGDLDEKPSDGVNACQGQHDLRRIERQ
jgi:hypothetical protein